MSLKSIFSHSLYLLYFTVLNIMFVNISIFIFSKIFNVKINLFHAKDMKTQKFGTIYRTTIFISLFLYSVLLCYFLVPLINQMAIHYFPKATIIVKGIPGDDDDDDDVDY